MGKYNAQIAECSKDKVAELSCLASDLGSIPENRGVILTSTNGAYAERPVYLTSNALKELKELSRLVHLEKSEYENINQNDFFVIGSEISLVDRLIERLETSKQLSSQDIENLAMLASGPAKYHAIIAAAEVKIDKKHVKLSHEEKAEEQAFEALPPEERIKHIFEEMSEGKYRRAIIFLYELSSKMFLLENKSA